ncbi:hypothetical protein C5167_035317 [Papaver somniferum]|uniref:Uncharacterized protein n=1 Tax=Papaver somniferum TaxID=3469 RepID=A0A4Y7KIY4_PAPSO|nr:hypothetical protein C5167_035317 [Papaver somniferum]
MRMVVVAVENRRLKIALEFGLIDDSGVTVPMGCLVVDSAICQVLLLHSPVSAYQNFSMIKLPTG